ncbi:MAG TPA: ABC transporter permease [Acholeplasmataceae bacterium]|jgi:sodium transport system permease protein|nr:ABC transporter permease [Acholeplasmataceae bacterium]HPX71503.1 ABC transporter permease [Acholeplasmataceae bacterium]
MKNILTIFKKEIRRVFTDRRMVMSLILPGVLIFIIYSIMGQFIAKQVTVDEKYKYEIVIVNYDNNLDPYFGFLTPDKFNITHLTETNDDYLTQLSEKKLDLYIVYPDDFYQKSLNYNSAVDGSGNSPIVKVYHNSAKVESGAAYNLYLTGLSLFQETISEKFRINVGPEVFDLITEESMTIQIITMLVPFLLIMFLYTGAMGISVESIAGEKERGTIATILATPIKRTELALGKTFALGVLALLSAASSFIGLMLSMPKLMAGIDLDLSIYGPGEYLLLLFVIIATTLVYVVIISIVSAFAKTIKEANAYAGMLSILNMVVGISSMAGVSTTSVWSYLIPIFNSTQVISAILSLEVNIINLLVTIVVNLGIVAVGVVLLTKMFNSEKVMFNS